MTPSSAPVTPPRPRSALTTIAAALAVSALDALLLATALGGLGPLLAHRRALALLAAWLIGGVILAFLRPDRSRPAAEVRREPPLVLLLLFFVPMFTPALSALGERWGWAPLPGGDTLRWGGVALSALGLFVRIAAMHQLGARFSPLVAVQSDHQLETRGLYARVRHPGYLGSLLAALGTALAFGSGFGLLPVALLLGLFAIRVRHEEALLARHFGTAWTAYRAHSGAMLPRL